MGRVLGLIAKGIERIALRRMGRKLAQFMAEQSGIDEKQIEVHLKLYSDGSSFARFDVKGRLDSEQRAILERLFSELQLPGPIRERRD